MVQQSLFDERDAQTGAPPARRASTLPPGERAAWEDWRARLLPGFVAPYGRALAASRLHRSGWWVDGLSVAGRVPRAAPGEAAFAAAGEALAAAGFALRGLRLAPEKPKDHQPVPDLADALPTGAPGNGRQARQAPSPASTVALASDTSSPKTPPPDNETLASVARDDLLATLGTAPAVLLLNPFAAPPLTAEELLPLCQRQAPTELLLTISAAQLARLAETDGSRSGPDAPPALTALLRSDAWKAIWAGPEKSAVKVQRTLELLRGLLKPHFLHICLATLDEVPTPAPRRLLLFASRQYASVALLNDFLCAEQARLANEREARALQGSWFARRRATARAAAWVALKEELHTLGRLRRARLWPDLKPLLVLEHFGQFSSADHDAALLELLREGRVFCRWSPEATPTAPPAERAPGPQDFLEFLEPKPRPTWRR